jgi:predicted unusual protein kinase regulating ubiquinone biosynthesis (AarF/ABC1/UbiB family)
VAADGALIYYDFGMMGQLTPPFSTNVIEKLSGDLYDLVYRQPFRLPAELIFVMRALSTFEGVGRSLDPGFSLMAIARPYLLPLMTASGNGPNDFLGELSRQAADPGHLISRTISRVSDKAEIHSWA